TPRDLIQDRVHIVRSVHRRAPGRAFSFLFAAAGPVLTARAGKKLKNLVRSPRVRQRNRKGSSSRGLAGGHPCNPPPLWSPGCTLKRMAQPPPCWASGAAEREGVSANARCATHTGGRGPARATFPSLYSLVPTFWEYPHASFLSSARRLAPAGVHADRAVGGD